ncbi:hypothetical protein [Mesorhizobium sp. CAU 1741]|uniref:shikimate dehydrogenase family protein n=1 Tax=Mesorhizobium sp. CAU 1741 TaxID=3140366 RepID=UPI00325A8AA4
MIGTPIAQARAPYLFNAYFASRGEDRIMVPLDVSTAALAGFVDMVRDATNCDGFVSTLPHKRALLGLVDEASETARALESVNVVRRDQGGRLSGDMADGAGFWNGAASAGFDPTGNRIVLAGTGAAGTAIAYEFAQRGGAHVALWSRDEGEVEALAARLAGTGLTVQREMPTSLEDYAMAINATPVGMANAPGTPFPKELLSTLPKDAYVADAITDPLETQLLRDAAALGLRTVDGQAMTLGQFRRLRDTLGV